MFPSAFIVSLLATTAIQSVAAHGVLVAVAGANGVTGQGFGVDPSTPRDGSTKRPFEQDTSIIRDNEVRTGQADACGRTTIGGNNDIATQLATASAAGLPSMGADGTISMTLHQVNGDGAGPYTCAVSADATGTTWTNIEVTQNVPGRNSNSNARATDFTLAAQAPAGTACTGGPNGDACIVRCRNNAAAGPFGGCVAVTNAATATPAAAGNTTAAATIPAAPATAAAAAAAAPAAPAGVAGKKTKAALVPVAKRAIKSRLTRGMSYWV